MDSRRTRDQDVPEDQRSLIKGPVRLAGVTDIEAFRRRLGTAQSKIAQAPDATRGGNATKRIRLRLDVPGYAPAAADAARLAQALARPAAAAVPVLILTWNPDQWHWPDQEFAQAVQVTAAGGTWSEPWTVGLRTGGVRPGDRAMLLRQHRDRGLVGSGTFTTGLYRAERFDGSRKITSYGDIAWDTIVDPEDRLPTEQLRQEIPDVKWDHLQGSGVAVPPDAAGRLTSLWAAHTASLSFRTADEPPGSGRTYPEGALHRVEVNRYERDRRARQACLAHWGHACLVCGLSFGDRYGPLGQDFIHVHHTIELSAVPHGYHVDPVTDLRPVCPNCHAMLHRTRPGMTIEQLRQALRG